MGQVRARALATAKGIKNKAYAETTASACGPRPAAGLYSYSPGVSASVGGPVASLRVEAVGHLSIVSGSSSSSHTHARARVHTHTHTHTHASFNSNQGNVKRHISPMIITCCLVLLLTLSK